MTMTTDRMSRRRLTALALVPAVAGLFGGSVAWAAATDPLAESAAHGAAAGLDAPPADEAALEARVAEAGARLAALRAATLGAEPVASAPASPQQPARTAPPTRSAPPAVDVVTRAS